ncbi:MAG: hypothetical protein P4M11_15990 [Candidatus Pacebacteria bacterium]|nr:hypothetical protein [Candidatus Paceibacterota bacterium]
MSLKLMFIMLFFIAFCVAQYFLFDTFFTKARYSLTTLVDVYSRDPYLAATMNMLREGLAKGTPELASDGSSLFQSYYNKTLDNEQSAYSDRIKMTDYYSELYNQLSEYESNQVCADLVSRSSTVTLAGCESDMNGTMSAGIRQAISIIMMHMFRIYENFITDPNRSQEAVIDSYLSDTTLNNICKSSGRRMR